MEGSYLLNSEHAESLCERISMIVKGRVISFLGGESACDKRNLYRVLLTEDGKKLLSYAATDTHFLSETYSDYENFVELLHLLPSLVGSGYHSFVRLFFEYLLGVCELPNPRDAEELWKRSLPLLEDRVFDRLSALFMEKRAEDITLWIFPTLNTLSEYETVDAYLSSFRERAENADLFQLDLSALEFTFPDLYHTEKSFSAIRDGKENGQDRSYFASQLLRVTGEICKARNIPLILSGKPSFAEVKRLFAYLEKADRKPRAFYAVPFDCSARLREILSELEEAGGLTALNGIVPTELSVSSSDSIDACLTLLAMYYPFGRLLFVAESKTDVEMRFEYERFLRMIASRLSSAVLRGELSEADAVTVGTNIMTSAALL